MEVPIVVHARSSALLGVFRIGRISQAQARATDLPSRSEDRERHMKVNDAVVWFDLVVFVLVAILIAWASL